MSQLWSDTVGTDLTNEWVEGSFANKLYKDTRTLRQELLKAKFPILALCNGCRHAPYHSDYSPCNLCLKATKYTMEPKPLVLWFRITNQETYHSENTATNNGEFKAIKMVPADDKGITTHCEPLSSNE